MTDEANTPVSPRFGTTRWSLVADAGAAGNRALLGELCGAYWMPLYVFARRSGHDEEHARDLVQDFFATLIEKDYLAAADRERGRFRTFLLAAFKHHASKLRDKERTLKRGGGHTRLALDFSDGERRYRHEPIDDRTAEDLYERRWALTLLDRALDRLGTACRRAGPQQAERFEALRPLLTGGPSQPYREIGQALRLSETAVKVAVHRLRGRYREALRAEIADTVTGPALVDDEIMRLMAAVRAAP